MNYPVQVDELGEDCLMNYPVQVDELGEDCLMNAARTCMSSKLIGADSEFFSKLVVEAAQAVKERIQTGCH